MRSERYLTIIMITCFVCVTAIIIAGREVPESLLFILAAFGGGLFGVPIGVKAERERKNTNGNGTVSDGK